MTTCHFVPTRSGSCSSRISDMQVHSTEDDPSIGRLNCHWPHHVEIAESLRAIA
jgi:hypothetical protein